MAPHRWVYRSPIAMNYIWNSFPQREGSQIMVVRRLAETILNKERVVNLKTRELHPLRHQFAQSQNLVLL